MPGLQQFVNANPVLVVVAAFIVGAIVFLAVRILLASAGCLVRMVVGVVAIIVILLLLRFMLMR